MAIPTKLQNWLDKNKVKYDKIAHKTVYTAFDLARTARAKIQDVAKTLLVKVDSKYVVVVIPAHYKLDMQKVKKAVKAKKISLAKENIMKKLLRIKPGSMTAFTAIYPKLEKAGKKIKEQSSNIPVYIDKAMLKSKKILMSAGSFEDAIIIKGQELVKKADANLGSFGVADAKKKVRNVARKIRKTAKKKTKKVISVYKKAKKKITKKARIQ